MAATGTVYMDVVYNTKKATADLVKATDPAAGAAAGAFTRTFNDKLAQTGAKTAQVGKQMSMALTLPLVGLGAVAVKEFTGYERSLASIEGLVGANAQQMDEYTAAVRRVGTEFGIGADAAADALYFITSSGLEGAAAIDALEQSAKAGAIGLGDTKVVADLLTSAIGAYGAANLNSAQAVDILTVAVREGKGEPADLAASISMVLPIASELGISFDQIAAAMAAMSKKGTDAGTAATQIRGILSALIHPSAQAEEALLGVGTSSVEIQKSLREKGLLVTLQDLTSRLGDNASATAMVFDDVRALTGVMTILGANLESTSGIFDATANSTGAADEAFKVFGKTAGFELNQAMASLTDSLIELGETLAPMVATVAGGLAKIFSAFSKLPGPVKTAIAVFGGLLAAAGPLLYVGGTLARTYSGLVKVWQKIPAVGLGTTKAIESIGQTSEMAATASTGLRGSMSKLAGVAGNLSFAAAAVGLMILTKRLDDNREAAEKWAAEQSSFGEGTLPEQLARTQAALDAARADAEQFASLDFGDTLSLFGSNEGRMKADNVKALEAQLDGLNEQIDSNTNASDLAARGLDDMGVALDGAGAAEDDAAAKTAKANTAFDEQRKAVAGLQSVFLGAIDGQETYQDSLDAIGDAQRSYEQSSRSVANAARSVQDAQRGVARATDAYEASLRDVEAAQRDVTEAENALNDALSPEEDSIALERARIRVEQAKLAVADPGEDATALDKKSAALDLRQAEIDLLRLEEEIAGRPGEREAAVTEAQQRLTDAQDQSQEALLGIGDAQRQVTDASYALRDAQYQQSEAALAVTDAQDKAARSALDLYAKQQDLTAGVRDNAGAVSVLLDQLLFLQGAYPEVAASLQPYIDKLRVLQALTGAARDPLVPTRENIPGGPGGGAVPGAGAPRDGGATGTGTGGAGGGAGGGAYYRPPGLNPDGTYWPGGMVYPGMNGLSPVTQGMAQGGTVNVYGYSRAPEDIVNEIEQRQAAAVAGLGVF